MPQVKDVVSGCNTALVSGLSRQIIAEMNLLIPNVLVNFADLAIQATGPAVTPFLQPAAKESLRLVIAERGQTLPVNSAYRTVAQQFLLRRQFELHLCNITAAALPGRSNHEDGLALDIREHAAWRPAFEQHGWRWLGPSDPVHFTFTGGGTRDDIGNIGVRAFQRLWNKHNPTDRLTDDGVFGPQTGARLAISPAEGFEGARLLRRDDPPMSGDDVRRLQEALLHAGFALQADGVFGPATEAAVKEFQEKEGLHPDGVVGPATRRELGLVP